VYALSKYTQEQLTLTVCAAYGIEAVALRLFNVFGPGQALSNPYTGVLAIFAGRLLNGKPPLVFEDGEQRRDFVHVEDVARAFRLAMNEEQATGSIFNIGSGRSYTIAEVAGLLASAMEREEIAPHLLNKSRAGDIRHCFADIGKAARVLGYAPEHALEESVHDLAGWVLSQSASDRSHQAHFELEQRGLVV
jgi:dTDP-L-rhamnose 4-epimerase